MNSEQELRDLFRAERAVNPRSGAVERGFQRLSEALATNVTPAAVASGPLKLGVSAIPKWLLGGFALGLVGASAAGPLRTPASVAPSNAPPARIAAWKARQPVAMTAESAEAGLEAAPSGARSAGLSAAQPARTVPAASSARAASFDAELALISLAKSELDARHLDRARARLAEHAERFPQGIFAVEREGLLALSGCVLVPPNIVPAKRFAHQHPNSPLLERLERTCELQASGTKQLNGSPTHGERMIEPSAGEIR